MQATMFEEELKEVQPETSTPEASSHVEEDGVDWCAWWAEYAETLE